MSSRHTIINLILVSLDVLNSCPPCAQAAIRGLADLVVQCTAFSPDHRPSFADILQVKRPPDI